MRLLPIFLCGAVALFGGDTTYLQDAAKERQAFAAEVTQGNRDKGLEGLEAFAEGEDGKEFCLIFKSPELHWKKSDVDQFVYDKELIGNLRDHGFKSIRFFHASKSSKTKVVCYATVTF